MSNENNENKDIANSLSKYNDYENKYTNLILDSANAINNWYANQLNKMSESEISSSRLETSVDNCDNTINELDIEKNQIFNKIETKVNDYDELQTNTKDNQNVIKNTSIIKTQTNKTQLEGQLLEKEINKEFLEKKKNREFLENREIISIKKANKKNTLISSALKGAKTFNNATNKFIKSGKSINVGLNEGGLKSFENSSNKIMTKPIKKVTNKITNKATNILSKGTKKVVKKVGTKVVKNTTNTLVKVTKLLAKLITDIVKLIISMLPQIAPIIIIMIIIVAFCSFFGLGMNEDIKSKYESYMITTQNEYDKTTVEFYNQGKVVDGAIEGKGMINWRAPLSIIQMLNGDLTYDAAEIELLNAFKNAELFEKITDVTYTYEKEIENTDEDGNTNTQKQTVTETKKVVSNASLDDYINWCSNNFSVINKYKSKKNVKYDYKQTKFTDSEIEQIKLLYNSNSFFELFSADFKSTYAYAYVNIGDEQLQAIYDEFLRNAGKRYLMDHSNLKYDECMDYYDCSSWVIHCLAHCGIKIIPNTTAQGIYNNYCYPVDVNDRKAGDLIFLKNTYNTGDSISHIGIYMGELDINGENTEWIIDTRWESIRC